MAQQKPIVYFAFANQGENYLPALNDEIQGVKSYFQKSAISGYVKFWIDENADRKQLVERFKTIKREEDPKIIHFSGHADKDYWLLTDNQDIDSNSLGNLLRGINNVKLVFMNGCCTKELKNFLLDDIGVEAVIATSQKISDTKAAGFAKSFYNSWLSENVTLIQAFNEACGEVEGFTTFDDKNCRGIKREEEVDDFAWGLHWKEENAKNSILNEGFKFEMSFDKESLLEEYEVALKEINSEYEKIKNQVEANQTKLDKWSAKQIDEDVQEVIDTCLQLRDSLLKPINAHYEQAQKIWQQIINYDRTPKLKAIVDTFNFTKELSGLDSLLEGQGKGVPNGVYLLRGTLYCGLGLLSHRVVTYARPITYGFKPPMIDFEGVSETNEIVDKIKNQIFHTDNNISVSTLEDLAKSLSEKHLADIDINPFVLVLNNVHTLSTSVLTDFLDRFWKSLLKEIQNKVNTRRIVILLIEKIEAKKKASDDGDFDLTEVVEDNPSFCRLPISFIQKKDNIFLLGKVAKLEKIEIDNLLKTSEKY